MKNRYNIRSRDDWFRLCLDFKRVFHANWLDYQDTDLSVAFGEAMIDISALEKLVSPGQEESIQVAILRKYGKRGVEFVERVL